MDINIAILTGRVGEVMPDRSFTLMNKTGFGLDSRTITINCTGGTEKIKETVAKYIRKNQFIGVRGRLLNPTDVTVLEIDMFNELIDTGTPIKSAEAPKQTQFPDY